MESAKLGIDSRPDFVQRLSGLGETYGDATFPLTDRTGLGHGITLVATEERVVATQFGAAAMTANSVRDLRYRPNAVE